MLKSGKEFNELTQADFEMHHKEKTLENMQKKAKDLGFTLVPILAAA